MVHLTKKIVMRNWFIIYVKSPAKVYSIEIFQLLKKNKINRYANIRYFNYFVYIIFLPRVSWGGHMYFVPIVKFSIFHQWLFLVWNSKHQDQCTLKMSFPTYLFEFLLQRECHNVLLTDEHVVLILCVAIDSSLSSKFQHVAFPFVENHDSKERCILSQIFCKPTYKMYIYIKLTIS